MAGAEDRAPRSEEIAASITERVNEIMSQAEQAGRQVQEEVEARTARQAAETRLAADADADRIRRAAETQAAKYLTDARARVEEYAAARQQRIDDLTTELLERAQLLQRRLDEAIDVRARLDETLDALTAARALTGAEGARKPDPLPPIEADDPTGQQVRNVAQELPEPLRQRSVAPPSGPTAVPPPPSPEGTP